MQTCLKDGHRHQDDEHVPNHSVQENSRISTDKLAYHDGVKGVHDTNYEKMMPPMADVMRIRSLMKAFMDG